MVVYGKWKIYRKVKAVLGLHCWKRGIVKGKEKDVNFLLDFARRARNEVGEMEQKCKLWGFEVLFRALLFDHLEYHIILKIGPLAEIEISLGIVYCPKIHLGLLQNSDHV